MTKSGGAVRVRFAPSPTGHLHIGGARTALFNYLYARRHGGTFVLRIEDTDQERSTPESVAAIIDSLKWLGLSWDEGPGAEGSHGPYFQSERRDIYNAELERLIAEGKAYHCFCTPGELGERREAAKAAGQPAGYDGRCRRLTPAERDDRKKQGLPSAVRLAVPDGTTEWPDIVRGAVSFRNDQFGDFVIAKSDGFPTYHFAVVVDDALMEITHVIRGDDHISNTPRHLMIYDALGKQAPLFAHVPIILGSDGGRLSKRHGATSVGQYRDEGYLPEAMVNYLALLGWSTSESRQTFTPEELVAEFSLERVVKSSAVFDPDKLLWLNTYHYLALDPARRVERLLPYWDAAGEERDSRDRDWLAKVVEVVGDRVKVLPDINRYTGFFFRDVDPDAQAEKLIKKAEPLGLTLSRLNGTLGGLEPFSADLIEEAVKGAAEGAEVGLGKIIQPLRAAVMGQKVGPGLFESFELLGKEAVVARIGKYWPAG